MADSCTHPYMCIYVLVHTCMYIYVCIYTCVHANAGVFVYMQMQASMSRTHVQSAPRLHDYTIGTRLMHYWHLSVQTVLLATHFERAVLRFLPEQPLANLLLYPRHTRSLGNGLGSSAVLRRPVIHQLRLGIGNCLKGSLSQM